VGRFYCQRHVRQVLVFDDGAVIEVLDVKQPAASSRTELLQRLGSVLSRTRRRFI
jgi:hypothetical protein